MATSSDLRRGFGEAWGALVEGWRKLYRRAAGAMTRFTLSKRGAGEDTLRNAGWGLLAAEVCDGGDHVLVRLEAPGMDKQDFDLAVVDGALLVRGEKRMERERNAGRYHLTECAYGRFERLIPLPEPVDDARAKASYRGGVLRIELPKTSARKPRVIAVESA